MKSLKQLLVVLTILVSFSVSSPAQTLDSFDIATFQPPAGWKKVNKEGIVIFNTANQQKGTYAMIVVYRSGESSGNAKHV